ncbi:MAG: hypothetical protein ABEN55_00670 [Bradymonadaceae bacterium]
MDFTETALRDGVIERTVSALANRHGIDDTAKIVVEGIRTNDNLPATPDVHIDSRKEVNPPGDGNGVQRPLNLPVQSDLEPSQGTGSNQPIWRDPAGEEPYYEHANDDRWTGAPPVEDPRSLVFASVVDFTDGSDSNGIVGHRNSGSYPHVLLWQTGTPETVLEAHGSDNNEVQAKIPSGNVDPRNGRTAIVGTFNYVTGEVYIAMKNAADGFASASNSLSFTGNFRCQNLTIGAIDEGGTFGMSGALWTAKALYRLKLSKSAADRFCEFLARDHGIIE